MEEKLKKMEELDARIEKINFDLIGLESRKKELEDEKLNIQKEIDKLEKEKNSILRKTDNMRALQKFIYIVVSLRTDLKRVELINTKVSEYQKGKDNIQNKIDIQNVLYTETIKEKDKYIEQRRELYIEKTREKENVQEINRIGQIKAFTKIHEIAAQFKDNKIMNYLSELVEKEINQSLLKNSKRQNSEEQEEQEEM